MTSLARIFIHPCVGWSSGQRTVEPENNEPRTIVSGRRRPKAAAKGPFDSAQGKLRTAEPKTQAHSPQPTAHTPRLPFSSPPPTSCRRFCVRRGRAPWFSTAVTIHFRNGVAKVGPSRRGPQAAIPSTTTWCINNGPVLLRSGEVGGCKCEGGYTGASTGLTCASLMACAR